MESKSLSQMETHSCREGLPGAQAACGCQCAHYHLANTVNPFRHFITTVSPAKDRF